MKFKVGQDVWWKHMSGHVIRLHPDRTYSVVVELSSGDLATFTKDGEYLKGALKSEGKLQHKSPSEVPATPKILTITPEHVLYLSKHQTNVVLRWNSIHYYTGTSVNGELVPAAVAEEVHKYFTKGGEEV